jgi:hypothetical protein
VLGGVDQPPCPGGAGPAGGQWAAPCSGCWAVACEAAVCHRSAKAWAATNSTSRPVVHSACRDSSTNTGTITRTRTHNAQLGYAGIGSGVSDQTRCVECTNHAQLHTRVQL